MFSLRHRAFYLAAFILLLNLTGCSEDPPRPSSSAENRNETGIGEEENPGKNPGNGNEEGSGSDDNGTTDDGEDPEEPFKGSLNGHRWVDLGLSVRWAEYNLGGDDDPLSPGGLYKWGAISPVTTADANTGYPPVALTDISGSEYDAATALWGAPWRLPTKAEMEELLSSSCTPVWTSDYGYEITGSTGASIFLPAAGYCDIVSGTDSYDFLNPSTHGRYWTSSLSTGAEPSSAFALTFRHFSNDFPTRELSIDLCPVSRYSACSIRPVCPR